MKTVTLLSICLLLMSIVSCKAQNGKETMPTKTPPVISVAEERIDDSVENSAAMIPKAVIYKTNGDYSKNVSVTLNGARNKVLSYPDPIDVSPDWSVPTAIADGWLLDRRGGIGTTTAFLDVTYAEYAKLPKAMSTAEILQHVIKTARVTEVAVLKITLSEAEQKMAKLRDSEQLKKLIAKKGTGNLSLSLGEMDEEVAEDAEQKEK